MKTLVIKTIAPEIELLLMDQEKVLEQTSWMSQRDEVTRLLPEMELLLKKNNWGFEDLARIVVVNGVGGFASTRIGVTIANVLAMALECELYEMTIPKDQAVDMGELLDEFWKTKPQPIKMAIPVYGAEPMISPSKKKKFT